MLKISIVTVVLNREATIKDCMDSIYKQDYGSIEHIIIDGLSTDATLDIIKKNKTEKTKLFSEKDNGLYDAMNKGLKLATGDIVGILNSDDIYTNSQCISQIAEIFEKEDIDCLYGNIEYVDQFDTEKTVRFWKSTPFKPGSFKKGWHPPHPSFFVKKDVYEKYGYFNTDLELSADFELMLRFIERFQIKSFYFNNTIVKMRLGGATNKSIRNIVKGNINCYQSFKNNDLDIDILYYVYRLVPKLLQFFKRA